MLRIRKMLPGETRTYNSARYVLREGNTQVLKLGKDSKGFVAILVGEDTVIEAHAPCRVHYSQPERKKR